MHHLLERQLKKIFKDNFQFSPELKSFLEIVSNTYDGYDQDRKFLEHSFDLSSKEFSELNEKVLKLLEELKAEKASIDLKVIERTKELQDSQRALMNILEDAEEARKKA